MVKNRQDTQVIKTSFFLAFGINDEGQKELLGMWLAESEGAVLEAAFSNDGKHTQCALSIYQMKQDLIHSIIYYAMTACEPNDISLIYFK